MLLCSEYLQLSYNIKIMLLKVLKYIEKIRIELL
jgi:hypothetical protein